MTPADAPTRTATPTGSPAPASTQVVAPPERIHIEAIGLAAPVVAVGQHALRVDGRTFSQWDVPDQRAAGWHQNSALPGQPGNVVLNGHHNTHGSVFADLVHLHPGDSVVVEAGGARFHYLVAQTLTLAEAGEPVAVRQDNARWVLPTPDERLTLVTCWPPDSNTHRLVIIALPASIVGLPRELP